MRISDWSSDVCSSDLAAGLGIPLPPLNPKSLGEGRRQRRSAGWRNIDRAFTLPHLPLRPRHLVGVEPTPEPAPQDPMQTEPLRGIVEDAWEARESISPQKEDRKSTRLNTSH